jgi:hypothetical protein
VAFLGFIFVNQVLWAKTVRVPTRGKRTNAEQSVWQHWDNAPYLLLGINNLQRLTVTLTVIRVREIVGYPVHCKQKREFLAGGYRNMSG